MIFNLQLVEKYFSGTATKEEAQKVLDWFETPEGKRFLQERMKEDQSFYINTDEEPDELDPHQVLNKIEDRIAFTAPFKKIAHHRGTRTGVWAVAASVLLIVGALFMFELLEEPQTKPDILQYVTEANEHQTLVLADGTKIRMNEQTTVKIPQPFGLEKRRIKLAGEAFFEVAKDSTRPFIVQAGAIQVKVLGTVFNVKAPDSASTIQVAVAEGLVAMHPTQAGREGVLLPKNTIGVYSRETQSIQKYKGAVTNYMSWMTGRMVFHKTPFAEVVRQLEWIYGIDCTLNDRDLKGLRLTADFSAPTLQQVLQTIAYSLGIDYQKEGSRVQWDSK